MLSLTSADNQPGDERIAANVRRLRKLAGLSQAAVANAMRQAGHDHWHQNTVSRVETAKQGLRMGDIGALNRILRGDVLDGVPIWNEGEMTAALDQAFVQLLVAELEGVSERIVELQQHVTDLKARLDKYQRLKRGKHPEAP